MSHSVRRLWTGAMLLLSGCQALPTPLSDALLTPQQSELSWVDDESPLAQMAADAQSSPEETAVEAAAPDVAFHSIDSTSKGVSSGEVPAQSSQRPNASRSGDAGDAAPAGWTGDQPDITPEESAAARSEPENGSAIAERSLLEDFRARVFRQEEPAELLPLPKTSTAPPASEGLVPRTPSDRQAQAVPGHSPPGRRSESESRELPLDAPTPFTSLVHDNLLDQQEIVPPPITASPGATSAGPEAPKPAEKGIVGSLFDVFGFGGERLTEPKRVSSEEVRPARVATLEPPLMDNSSAPNAAALESLRKPLQTIHWQEELDRLTTLLEAQLANQTPGDSALEQDYYVRQQVALRLLYLIGSRRPDALQAIPNCDPSKQEFWTAVMWALSDIFDDEALPEESQRARETADRLRTALIHIVPEAGLKLSRSTFCRQIDGFGRYLPYEHDEFSSGQSVLIYTEVENFQSTLSSQGEFITTLQSTLSIHQNNTSGPVVFLENLPATDDRCLSRRWDYFHSYRITLPSNLTPGRYVLTLAVRDVASHKQGTTSLNFVIH